MAEFAIRPDRTCRTRTELPRVDIMTAAWTVTFDQAWPSRVVRRIAGVRVPYLGRDDLIRSKRTGRLADLADIERLEAIPSRRRR